MPLVQACVDAAIDAALANADFMQLHDGDPGSGGTDNVAAEVSGREAITWQAASGGETQATVTFEIETAGGPYTHITFWSAAQNGTFQGSAELTPAESFAGAGELAVTVTVTGSSS